MNTKEKVFLALAAHNVAGEKWGVSNDTQVIHTTAGRVDFPTTWDMIADSDGDGYFFGKLVIELEPIPVGERSVWMGYNAEIDVLCIDLNRGNNEQMATES